MFLPAGGATAMPLAEQLTGPGNDGGRRHPRLLDRLGPVLLHLRAHAGAHPARAARGRDAREPGRQHHRPVRHRGGRHQRLLGRTVHGHLAQRGPGAHHPQGGRHAHRGGRRPARTVPGPPRRELRLLGGPRRLRRELHRRRHLPGGQGGRSGPDLGRRRAGAARLRGGRSPRVLGHGPFDRAARSARRRDA